MNPFKAAGSALGVIFALWLVWFGYHKYDEYRKLKYQAATAGAQAHADSAKVLIDSSSYYAARNAPVLTHYRTLSRSPAVQNNPVAKGVADTCDKVVDNLNGQVRNLQGAYKQKQAEVDSVKSAGSPPGPRAVPYADFLGSWRSGNGKNRLLPLVRAGVDYRLLPYTSVKLEGTYEPPPTPKPGEKTANPEFRVNLGAHISFR